MHRIPLAVPDLAGNESAYALDAIESSWISSTGRYVDDFERSFSQMCDARFAVAVSNGTAALHVALVALGLSPGDEVLVPSLTYISTANAVRYLNGRPVFVDVDPDTWCIDPSLLEQQIRPRTRGIIAVHLYGHPADMDAINAIAERHGLWVIEDAAEAHFARYRDRLVGGLATIGTFSFYGNKLLTSGEGGAVTVNDPDLASRLRLFKGQGMDPDRRYFFPVIGYNYRLTNVACAILCAQLERVEHFMSTRHAIFDQYRTSLAGIPGIGFQPVAPWAEPAPWLFSITIDPHRFGIGRDDLINHLELDGIETRPFFHPIHRLPPYVQSNEGMQLPNTDRLAETGLNLPTHTQMTEADVDRITSRIASVLAN